MKIKSLMRILVLSLSLVIIAFSLTACMDEADYYTKSDVDSKIAEQAALHKAEIDALKADYEAKIAALQAENNASKEAIEALTAAYNEKVAELEASDKANKDALDALKAEYEAKITELEAKIDALLSKHDHVFGAWSTDTATCTAGGIRTRQCTKCEYTERENTSSLGHNFTDHAAKAPTCAEEGNDAYKSCSRCSYTTYSAIPALHDLGDFIAEISAECTEDGQLAHYYCSVCDKYYDIDKKELSSIVIKATGHNTVDGVCAGCYSEGLEYKLIKNGKEYAVIGRGECNDARIVIPKTYNGKPVTMISSRAFQNYKKLVSVTIPESVSRIDSSAFDGCHNLTEVINHSALEFVKGEKSFGSIAYYATEIHTSESRVERDGNYTFYTDSDGNSYLINYLGGMNELVLPENYKGGKYGIGPYAFYSCSNLKGVIFAENSQLSSIGKYAFDNCDSLTSVVIPDSVTSIGDYAFRDCDSLTSVVIGDSVTSIGNYAFYDCDSLTSVKFKNTEGWWYSSDAEATSGTSISSSSLADKSIAARYLKSTYYDYYWHRS